ncbi:hypothetical protein D4768_21230 [Rhodococcus erythropolis]|nr:hypothetical protein D4768_21230 [Rhodococcus erythropolis]
MSSVQAEWRSQLNSWSEVRAVESTLPREHTFNMVEAFCRGVNSNCVTPKLPLVVKVSLISRWQEASMSHRVKDHLTPSIGYIARQGNCAGMPGLGNTRGSKWVQHYAVGMAGSYCIN